MQAGYKTVLTQAIYKGQHYHVYKDAAESLADITDIKSAYLVAIPVEYCLSPEQVKQYVQESIKIGDCVGVLETLIAKEGKCAE